MAQDARSLAPGSGAGAPGSGYTRRRFLAGLGMLAGAMALVPAIERARRPAASVEAGRPLLGTWVRVVARHPDRERAARAVARAFAAIREVDAQMSVHREDSDLTRVNRAAGVAAVRVPAALATVVASALDAARRSRGLYDPTVLALMRAYGFYGPRREAPPTAAEVDRALACTGWGGVALDRAAGTLALRERGAGLDLGSIGKGWAVDVGAAALRAESVQSGLVDAGGNVYALGTPGDGADGWSIAALHPLTGATTRVFVLRDAAVATSSNCEHFVTLAGARFGHILDARRGVPADGHLAVSVVAKTGLDSDRLSTTAFVLGPSRFRGWPEALDVFYQG